MDKKKYSMTFSVKQDTAENWKKINPVLKQGEFGIEYNKYIVRFKIGNGIDPWTELNYPVFTNIDYEDLMLDVLYDVLCNQGSGLPMRTKQQINTTEYWEEYNPVLLNGELGIEKYRNTFKIKIGDGVNHWNDLPYLVLKDAKTNEKVSNRILAVSILSVVNSIIAIGALFLSVYQ